MFGTDRIAMKLIGMIDLDVQIIYQPFIQPQPLYLDLYGLLLTSTASS